MENKYIYNKNYVINFTEVGEDAKLNLTSAINLAQNMTGEYFESFGSDNLTLRKKDNAAWVLTKTKVHFEKHPSWKDKVKCTSYTTEIRPARVELETLFKDDKSNLLFIVKHEICPIDVATRKIKKVQDITYPDDVEAHEEALKEKFLRLKESFEEKDKVLTQKVHSTDIDFIGHVNNAVYVRYIMSTFDCKFLKEHKITEFEIHYLHECKEKDNLKIYRKENENKIEFLIKNGEIEAIKAFLAYK